MATFRAVTRISFMGVRWLRLLCLGVNWFNGDFITDRGVLLASFEANSTFIVFSSWFCWLWLNETQVRAKNCHRKVMDTAASKKAWDQFSSQR